MVVGGDHTLPPADRPRILVVDDDEDTRQLIAFALGEKSYAVTEVADGEAALAALRDASFDLVITDYDMPGLTGSEMLERATATGVLGDASSLVVTAHPDPRDLPEETPLLRKPLDLERLLVQVRMILPDRETAPSKAATTARTDTKDGGLDLVLYVSARSPASLRARHRMEEVLAGFDASAVRFEVCDLFKHAAAAERDRVVFTPTLVKRSPAPRAWILGDLASDDVVRDLLIMCGVAPRERSSDG
jgi:CheY-like chemotaxis protein